jgi:chromosome segregation ATPase
VREGGPAAAYTAPRSAPRGQSEAPMQQMKEPPSANERSRRRPPRRRSDDPVPIPDPRSRSRRKRTVKLQEVLKAYQRAVVEVLEQRIEEASRASADAARQAVAEALAERPQGLDEGEVANGVVAYADERFQALSIRLERIEEALRGLAGERPPGEPEDAEIERRLDSIAQAVSGLGADRQQLGDQLGRKTGRAVVAVAQVIRDDLEAIKRDLSSLREWMQGMDTSVRSMHRTLAWEGMRAPRSGPNDPNPQ